MRFSQLILLGLTLGLGATLANAAPIRVVGSDLLADSMSENLKDYAKRNDIELTIAMRGSRAALEQLELGKADFGLLIFGAEDKRPGVEFTVLPVGYLTAVVIAPAGVSLNQINYGQLAGVFGANEAQIFRRWGDLGVTGAWSSRGITAMAASRDGLALDLFRYEIMSAPELRSTVVLFNDSAALHARLGGEEGGIGIVATPPVDNPRLKVLLVAKDERDVAYGPSPENLHSGDYPLRLPLHLVFRKGDVARLNLVLRHLLADETMPALLAAGVIPLPVQARNQLVFELESP
jgi:phosphate transport system substrate-binding protein